MPLPVPLLPPVTVIQPVLLLAAVQLQPLVVVTDAVWVAPAATTFCEVGATENPQAPACVTFKVCPAIVSVPGRELVDVLVATV